MQTHKSSKFLFYHFNDFQRAIGQKAYKIRYTLISDDQCALDALQSKD